MSAPRCRKLTPEEKRAAWRRPESNAGEGWTDDGVRGGFRDVEIEPDLDLDDPLDLSDDKGKDSDG